MVTGVVTCAATSPGQESATRWSSVALPVEETKGAAALAGRVATNGAARSATKTPGRRASSTGPRHHGAIGSAPTTSPAVPAPPDPGALTG